VPVPSWVIDLAEVVSANRIDDQGVSQPVTYADLLAMKTQVQESGSADTWTRLAKWLFADPSSRSISPFSAATLNTLRQNQAALDKTNQTRTEASVSQQPAEPDFSEQQHKEIIAKLNFAKYWMVAFNKYADQHQWQYPKSFEEAAAFMPDEFKTKTSLAPDQFEIVYQGSTKDINYPASIIVIREKQSWRTAKGGWAKAYGFADGHCEIHKADDGNFGPWESQNMPPSRTAAQPGQ
jgi:hypothetical protein